MTSVFGSDKGPRVALPSLGDATAPPADRVVETVYLVQGPVPTRSRAAASASRTVALGTA